MAVAVTALALSSASVGSAQSNTVVTESSATATPSTRRDTTQRIVFQQKEGIVVGTADSDAAPSDIGCYADTSTITNYPFPNDPTFFTTFTETLVSCDEPQPLSCTVTEGGGITPATVIGVGSGDEVCNAVTNSAYGTSPSWVCVVVSMRKTLTGEYGDTDPDCFPI
jgi:hypothetical protein